MWACEEPLPRWKHFFFFLNLNGILPALLYEHGLCWMGFTHHGNGRFPIIPTSKDKKKKKKYTILFSIFLGCCFLWLLSIESIALHFTRRTQELKSFQWLCTAWECNYCLLNRNNATVPCWEKTSSLPGSAGGGDMSIYTRVNRLLVERSCTDESKFMEEKNGHKSRF